MTIPQIYLMLLGSILPPDHPSWDDPEIVCKSFSEDGSEKAAQILDLNLGGVTTARQYAQLSKEEKIKHQIRCMQ